MQSGKRKPKGLFVNTAKANCIIRESGQTMYQSLRLSDRYEIDYLEIDEESCEIPGQYDFYAFNYHCIKMGWLDTKSVRQLPGLRLAFLSEVLPDDPFKLCPEDDFDLYCALDPTMNVEDTRVYAFPRVLETAARITPYRETSIPVIGTSGFATNDPGFELVINAVNKEFDEAIVKINITPNAYNEAAKDYREYYAESFGDDRALGEFFPKVVRKERIHVVVTYDYMTKDELVEWCGQNTLNCFLFTWNQPGLTSMVDQAVASGRPLAISTNGTFRHIHPYLTPYPHQSLKESIASSQPHVLQMQRDWSPENFAAKFERVLEDAQLFSKIEDEAPQSPVRLQKKGPAADVARPASRSALGKVAVTDFVPPIVLKVARKIKGSGSQVSEEAAQSESSASAPEKVILPFVHEMLGLHGQHGEDLLVDWLLSFRSPGFYVDVGANDPTYNSNTRRFYDRGWSGINIEPVAEPFRKLCETRPRDINLNVCVALERGKMPFYQLSGDTTLSSLSLEAINKVSETHTSKVTAGEIDALPLEEIFDQYLGDRRVDFMSVDAEGFDLNVLKSNNWTKYRPSLLLVEINNQYNEIVNYLDKCDYLLIFNNHINGLFLDKRTSDKDLRSMLSNYSLKYEASLV